MRSGWIILLVMIVLYTALYVITYVYISAMSHYFVSTGDINRTTGALSPFVLWLNEKVLPLANQVLTDVVMTAVPVIAWGCIMKQPMRKLGINCSRAGGRSGLAGMILGAVNCSIIFFLVITVGGGHVVSLTPQFSIFTLWWVLAFVLVAFGEEILNRGFFMAALRRCRCLYFIMLVPSVIFGMIHLMNPGVTFFSVFNIVLVGVLFSYMFIKSGNIWMCIGYHFTWNTFQGILYGMPVSGLDIPGVIHTEFAGSNILNGGLFGIEGGVLTTVMTLLSFIFVRYYYRNTHYNFLTDTYEEA